VPKKFDSGIHEVLVLILSTTLAQNIHKLGLDMVKIPLIQLGYVKQGLLFESSHIISGNKLVSRRRYNLVGVGRSHPP